MKHPLPLLSLLILIVFACSTPHPSTPEPSPLPDFSHASTGTLHFISDTTGMGSAIAQSTGSFTHVCIIEHTDSIIYLWDASPSLGVARRPIDSLPPDYFFANSRPIFSLRALNVEFDTARLLRTLHQLLGQPYDLYFHHDNGRIYCSELVYECFFSPQGQRLFSPQPMNFLAPDSTMPPYWVHLFDSLQAPIPQGLPGTNPTDLFHSSILSPLH